MIGLDFPIRPEWIHDVLQLWQPGESLPSFKLPAYFSAQRETGTAES